MKKDNIINCFKCKHFIITWDKSRPYGCNTLGFKSKVLPSLEVYRSSGEKCMLFTPKG
jgi:hypothetical protein